MQKWVETVHCKSLAHCDFCLGSAKWHEVQSERFDMPEFGTCPYGETLAAGKARRADRLVARVAAGIITTEQATDAAVKLGLSLD